MKRSDVFQSKLLSQTDILAPLRATIVSVGKETVGSGSEAEQKAVAHFAGYLPNGEQIKPMVINNFNWCVLEERYGDESDFWAGKPVEIYVDKNVMFGGKRVGGLRLRIPANMTGANDLRAAVWTMAQCLEKCSEVGISKDEMIQGLKSAGQTAFNSTRATPLVQKMIATKIASVEVPFDGGDSVPSGVDEIPF